MAHALLSPSGAHRWLHCTPSARLEAERADTGSVYAREGTLAHAIAERILKGEGYEDLKDHELFYPGMIDEVEDYTSYCMERFNEAKAADAAGAVMLVEERLDFSDVVPEGFGTGDCVIVQNGHLEIIDLKFGKGVVVDPERNPQLMLYAWGAYRELHPFYYSFRDVTMTVAQVRLEGISSYTMTIGELEKWVEETVKPAAALAYKGKGEFCAGDWCGFCKVRTTCRARAEQMQAYLDLKRRASLDDEEIARIILAKKEIEGWLKDIDAYALDEALAGASFPGLKLVEGRSNRKINDPEALAERLIAGGYEEESIYKPKQLETLTKLEGLVGKKAFAELGEGVVVKPPGKPTLVAESDKRPAMNTVEDDFEFDN